MTKKEPMKSKSDQELITLLTESRETLRNERFSAAGARAKDPSARGKMRKMIARALTEQSRRFFESGSRPEAAGHVVA